jgi:hypothetical protein
VSTLYFFKNQILLLTDQESGQWCPDFDLLFGLHFKAYNFIILI